MLEYFSEKISIPHSMYSFPLNNCFVNVLNHETRKAQSLKAAQQLHYVQVSSSSKSSLLCARKNHLVDKLEDQLILTLHNFLIDPSNLSCGSLRNHRGKF